MDWQRRKGAPASRHVYHVSLAPLVYPIVLFGVILCFDAADGPRYNNVLPFFTAAFASAVGLVALLVYFGGRLVVSPEGIAFYGVGFRTRTTWENVVGMAKARPFGEEIDVLLLREDALENRPWFRCMQAIFRGRDAVEGLSLEKYRQIIPVGYFKRAWQAGDLQQEIRKYAPQAFEPQEDAGGSSF